MRVLSALPAVDYRPSMVASYDDGDWVAIVLEDVEGHHPNLSDRAVMDAARRVVRAQSRELTPNPLRVESETLAGSVHRWYDEIAGVGPAVHPLLPRWWLAHETDLLARIATLPARLPAESWCHFDVRDDNLLVRPDGSVVIVDWGMSRPGPAWVDEMLLELHNITHTAFDEHVARIPAYGVASDHGRYDAVTDFVLALGMSLAVIAHEPVEEGLPRLNSFRRAESKRLLTGAGRRLQLG
jgi:aminoglycoside phosphotransferase (APT) family kinase protein